jgi:arsenite/tail-anchored protein-transporting ATPase
VRVLLITGKGGVGKTTVAASTAAWAASLGLRTLVMSTDAAHSLADAFDLRPEGHRVDLSDHLRLEQIDARDELEDTWGVVREWLVALVGRAGLDRIRAEELSVVPGMDELLALGDVVDRVESGEHDVVVVDCAPSAETIRLLSLPDVLGWWLRRLGPARDGIVGVVGPLIEQVTEIPMPGTAVLDRAERVVDRLARARALLTDPARTSARLVATPEGMVLAEARRTHTYLSLFGHRVDAVVMNRLLPDEVTDPWSDRWKEAQAEHLDVAAAAFGSLPLLRASLLPREARGYDALVEFGRDLYGGDDPTALLDATAPMRVEEEDGQPTLVLELPGAEKGDVDVGRRGDELLVTVGPYRRAVLLPDSLRGLAVGGARLDGGALRVHFVRRRRS